MATIHSGKNFGQPIGVVQSFAHAETPPSSNGHSKLHKSARSKSNQSKGKNMTYAKRKTSPLSIESRRGEWQPLLTGKLQQTALAAVWQIAESLSIALSAEANWNTPSPNRAQLASLACWKAEAALFYAYLAAAFKHAPSEEMAWDLLNEAISEAAEHVSTAYLFNGYSELGWIIANLEGILFGQEETESCTAVDENLLEQLRQPGWQADYDLIMGLAGYGIYALERLPQPAAAEIARGVVNKLWETAEHNEQGITWHSSAALLPAWQAEICPNGYYNLGLAHGVPGVIGLLGRNIAAGIEQERAQILLDGAIRWLLAQRQPSHCAYSFPAWAGLGIEPEESKIAWCYGDLGAGTALLYAARCARRADWEQASLEILRKAARRPFEQTGVFDVSLCHGAAGNAHIFNRVYQATGATEFKTAALTWIEQTLAFRQPGAGIAGFRVGEWNEDAAAMHQVGKPGFLDGVAGVGLALLAACTGAEPHWDRWLLVSVPRQTDLSVR
jgi:lantibiotic biosynthesis protein